MNTYSKSLFIFRRDIRLDDNTALISAFEHSSSVIPCFIFTDEQIKKHPYRSTNGFNFLLESLSVLDDEIRSQGGKLYIFHGDPAEIISMLRVNEGIDAVFINKDYTPYSRNRDRNISSVCGELGVGFHSYSDLLLVEPSLFSKADGRPYTVFTPFFKRASIEKIRRPMKFESKKKWGVLRRDLERGNLNLDSKSDDGRVATRELDYYRDLAKTFDGGSPNRRSLGGRLEAIKAISRLSSLANYSAERNFPYLDSTSILSPHNKFGTVSIREVYWSAREALEDSSSFLRELFWRDFFTHIAWHFPYVFSGAFHRRYDAIDWVKNEELFESWCSGLTGYPIVDAGIRELLKTGYMHNRVRMIVASFLTKDLHISWREGEAFFARHLTEYDPSVNNGSWQWAASTGCDAQPYFRIFNPWLQQGKFDPKAEYIKRWVPELSACSIKEIHGFESLDIRRPKGYPLPIVDHKSSKLKAIELFKQIS
jgi:deoxyribodipyrimidine photo-lyase